MDTRPIIVKIESQKCIESHRVGVSLFENVGVDQDGNRWQFLSETIHTYDDDTRLSSPKMGRDYGFTKLGGE